MTRRSALVTGAGGFIGYNLSNYLSQQGWNVRGIDLHYPQNPGPGRKPQFESVEGDFRDTDLMQRLLKGTNTLFHLASAHLQVGLDDSEYRDVNARCLPALYRASQQLGVEKVVHVSSVGIYGQIDHCPADEETPCHPQSIYGQTKLEGEKIALKFCRDHDFPITALRPAWVYGPGCPRTRKLYRTLRKGRFPMIGACKNLRHPLFITDLLKICELAGQDDRGCGEAYLIASENPITCRQLIEGFCDTFGFSRPWLRMPYALGRIAAFGAETVFGVLGKEPPISRRTLEFFDTDNSFDITKARRQLQFQPEYDLQRGLIETKPWLDSA